MSPPLTAAANFPFDQITRDIYSMDTAFGAINRPPTPDYDTAAGSIAGTGLMWYGTNFSRPVFKKILQQHRQSYYHIAWGGQGHLEKYQDLMPICDAIVGHGDPSTILTMINESRGVQIDDLTQRIIDMTATLNEASDQIEDLFPLVQRDR